MHNLINPFGLSRNNEKDYNIKAWGEGIVTAKPNQAIISLGVVTKDKDVKNAKDENAELANQVLKNLMKIGIKEEEIETSTYTISSMYDYQDGKKIFRGYEVKHIFKITIKDLSKVSEVIDVAAESGANVVNYIRFTVSNPEFYYNQALEKAVINARKKGEVVARTIGVKINKIPLRVNEKEIDRAVRYFEMSKLAVMDSSTPIQLGNVEFKSRVSVVFQYDMFE
ncbi:SIMPL domain-containing protein [Oceanirhabdus sp. W0125-5]|uniref:SIMPL domain-containing protein n=1 Tax=Oceanirhabdus sp. W0125-5 TaxID=2999116 RepID=UPI0022F321D9|nr:SIMPL domain-containing protein [Oceanirhabdus sp. W0125-5]WBW96725.1 SIMPL domain-containing protein [Oceanirhabdus sp. W0125-5]